ncbi:THUMP domain-containing class I SAM-dependent RNA methyltransferase [Clostridium weizhouense]|uniref:Class I SAM-dependent RNA methyltransferase n=1 Tax=Clostridium weizhouense TaxID=2859781 RepID=A0ABS7AQM0_9CLOT|nr:class I SAM-dependent RNA methyltransferase [Clostridium weizhouense]MBW6410922.1 class I SAM-dependent RNA methyltransferase [Clostridium weizhouense]
MYNLIATSTFGIESITAKELKALGYEDLKIENGKVTFEGDEMDIAIANVHLRTADRVLIKMAEFEARSFEELFQGTKGVKWHEIIPKDGVMHVVGKSVKSTLHSVPDCQSIVKKAVINSMSENYGISEFSESGPVYKIEVAILKDVVTLTIDTTGPGLHKRGYRELAGAAPLKETLAASMLLISRWRDDFELIDPFCGSGTILIEGAMIAQNIAPGSNRNFVCETWSDQMKKTFDMVREGAKKAEKNKEISLIGYDIDYRVLKVAMENAKKAGVDKYIKFQKRDFMNFSSSKKHGFIVSNPPYGERLGEREALGILYKHMGDIKRKLEGWDFNILTSIEGFEKFLNIKSTKNRKLYNGKIKCYYYQYFNNDKIKNPGDTLINELMD